MAARSALGGYRVEALGGGHDRGEFSCGVPELDTYLREQATQDMVRHTASAFVLLRGDPRVLGYYTLSQLSINLSDLPGATAKKLPRHPLVPAILIGRFAVDHRCHHMELGTLLLMDALERSWRAAQQVASYAVRVDATNESARDFYRRHDFVPFPTETMKLYIPMATLASLFTSE